MAVDMEKVRGMSPKELDKEERDLRDQIWKLRLQRSTGQLQDPYRVRRARRDLARILTIKRERELSQARAGSR